VNLESAGKKKESLTEERDPPSCFFSKLSFLHLNTCFYIAFHCKRTLERREKGMVETLKAHSFSSPGSKTPIFFYQSGRNCHAIFIKKKEELGTACFYNTYISHTKTKANLAAIPIKEHGGTRTEKGSWWWRNNNPLPRFLNYEPAKEGKKERPTNS